MTVSIAHIETSAQEVERTLSAIASATAQQSAASQDISRNIARIHEMTECSDASIQKSQSETDQLRTLAQDLRNLMEKFRV